MQQKSPSAGPQRTEQYSVLADIYDHLMDHVDYEAWADYLIVLCHVHNHVPKNILELACGTGNLTLELVNSGFSVVGSDCSTAMLKQATMKYSNRDLPGNRCFFIGSDMTSPPVHSVFDTILCIYDSINYLSTLENICDALESIVSRLKRGGVFIFDMCTEYNSIKNFTDYSSSEQFGGYSYERKSWYRKADRTQITEFTITSLTDGSVMHEQHVQYIYPLKDIRDMLLTIFPGQVRMFKDYTLDPPDERCERNHFYIIKP